MKINCANYEVVHLLPDLTWQSRGQLMKITGKRVWTQKEIFLRIPGLIEIRKIKVTS